MSSRPGTTMQPAGPSRTTTSAAPAGMSRSTRAMRPPSTSTSYRPSSPVAGSTTRPPLSSRFMLDSAGQQVQDGHPHGHAVGNLFEDHRARAVGDLRGDLHAAVHRAG